MSFEQSEPLGEAEALDEAALLRAKLKEAVNREPTIEDYDKALEAVEEMKRLAKEEPNFDKVIFKVMQIGNEYFQNAADGLAWLFSLGGRPSEQDRSNREGHLQMFEDAAARLQRLKAEADEN